jgi:uncharacterized protein (UPF0147 family)
MPQSGDPVITGLAKLLDPVVTCFTPEVARRVAELQIDPSVQRRIEELAEKCNEGTMTPEETAEYEAYVQAMDVIAVLQQQARALSMPSHTA